MCRPNTRLVGSCTGRRRLYWSADRTPVRPALSCRDLQNPQARRRRSACWLPGASMLHRGACHLRAGRTPSPHFALIPTSSVRSPRQNPYPSPHGEDLWASVSREAAIEYLNSALASAKQQRAAATRRNPSPLIPLARGSQHSQQRIRSFALPSGARLAKCCIYSHSLLTSN